MARIGEIRRSEEVGYKAKGQRYHIWAACEKCGKERWVQMVRNAPRKNLCLSCVRKLAGEKYNKANHQNWKGGKHNDNRGYVVVRVDKGEFWFPMCSGGYKGRYGGEFWQVLPRFDGGWRLLAAFPV